MMKKWKKAILLCVLIALLFPASVFAASPLPDDITNYCEGQTPKAGTQCISLFDMLTSWMSETGISFAASAIGIIDMIVWFFVRLVLAVFEMAVNGTWLDTFRDNVLTSLTKFMPETLRQVTLGNNGIMYIALMLAGLMMTIPFMGGGRSQLAKPDRVIIWGVIMAFLFISSTWGYDLIGMVESLRVNSARTIMGGDDTSASVKSLVLAPMNAADADSGLDLNTLAQLPGNFMEKHFPKIERGVVTVRLSESSALFSGVLNTEIETPESKMARIMGAARALLYGAIAFAAAIVVLLIAAAFVFLGVAAVVLIIFLMAALPLGFFEFGMRILGGFGEKYLQIVTYSFALALLARIAGGLMDALPKGDIDTATALVEWLLLLGSLYLALWNIFGASFKALTNSFSSFGSSLSASLGIGRANPVGGVGQTLGEVTKGAATGFAFGGAHGALIGGAAALIGGAGGALLGARIGSGNGGGPQEELPSQGRGNVFIRNGSGAPIIPPSPASPVSEKIGVEDAQQRGVANASASGAFAATQIAGATIPREPDKRDDDL